MDRMTRRLAHCCLATLLLMAVTTQVSAQAYPSRVIRLIVPFPPGGGSDFVARLLQPSLERALGQPIIIDNRTGAGGIVGTDYVAKSAPDGHTLGMALASHSVNPAINPRMPYDTERDLAPIILIGKIPLMFVANANVPARTMSEFASLARANPNTFNYASPGAGSQTHLIVAYWSKLAGVSLQHVPYRGGAPAIQATAAGETQFTVMSSLLSGPHIESGRLRPLATGSLRRERLFPDVPTMEEAGFPGFEAVTWIAMFAPADTPREVVLRLNSEINRIIQDPIVVAKLHSQGIAPAGGPPEVISALIATEIRRWTAIARENKISIGH
jgi:tripartite-type tricarboxylate transporter receptor subunit TctC